MEEKNLKELDIALFKAFNMLSDDVSAGFRDIGGALKTAGQFMRNQRHVNRQMRFTQTMMLAGAIAGGYYICKKFDELERQIEVLRHKGD